MSELEDAMQVNFFATLRPIVGGKTVEVEFVEGMTVRQVLQALTARFPKLRAELFDRDERLHGHVHVFVNGRDSVFLAEQLDTPLKPDDTVNVFPAVGGG